MSFSRDNLVGLSTLSLFDLHGAISAELKSRGVTRTQNSTGDFAEYLFAKAFGWELKGNSNSGYDALNGSERIQIKSRKAFPENKAPQLGEFSRFHERKFDTLAAIVFDKNYGISTALLMPWEAVDRLATTVQGKRRLHLPPSILKDVDVVDVTHRLREALATNCA